MLAPEMHIHQNDGKHLTRNQMEWACLVIYGFVLAVVYTIVTVLMLLGSGGSHHS